MYLLTIYMNEYPNILFLCHDNILCVHYAIIEFLCCLLVESKHLNLRKDIKECMYGVVLETCQYASVGTINVSRK
jgi:hypothetical protein